MKEGRTRIEPIAWAIVVSLVLLSMALSGPTAVFAQVQRVQADETFEDEVTVFEVEVPIQVFHSGEPVRGLTKDDFTVIYRGEPQDIVSFEVADVSTQIAMEASPAEEQQAYLPPRAARAMLLLFDFEFQSRGLVARAVESARRMVATQLHPSDRVAVVAVGGRQGARILTGFSQDRERTAIALDLIDALADAKPKRQKEAIALLAQGAPATAEGLAAEYGVTASIAFGDGLASVGIFSGPTINIEAATAAGAALDQGSRFGSGISEAFAIGETLSNFEKFREAKLYAEALGNLGTLLSGVEGQKYAVLFSNGPPLASLMSTAGPSNQEGGAGVARAMEEMFAQMVRAGWQIHALSQGQSQAAGVGNAVPIDAFNVEAPVVDAKPGSLGPSGDDSTPNYSDGGNSTWYLAEGTGGKAYVNATLPAIDQFLERTSVTYILRFILPGVDPGRGKERFKVLVSDPDFELQYRDFFYPPKPRTEMNQVETLVADAEDRIRSQSQQARRYLEFTAHAFVDPVRPGVAWLTVHLPASQLERTRLALGRDAEQAARLGVVAGVEKGGPAGEVALDQTIEIEAGSLANPPEDGLTFTGQLDLTPEDTVNAPMVRVAVELGANGASMQVPLQRWEKTQSFDTAVVGPFFLPPGLERLIVRGSNKDGELASLPLRAPSGAELVPLPFVEVRAGEELGIMLWTKASEPRTQVSVNAVPHQVSGALNSVNLSLERRGEVDGSVLWFAPLATTDLASGVYRIEGVDFDNVGVGYFRVQSSN